MSARREQGTASLWFVGLCLVLLLLGGLGLDLWRAFSERRALAAAADAAALAGASAIDTDVYRVLTVVQLDPVEARRRATASLASQLDRRAATGSRVHVGASSVTVEVDGQVEFSLLRLLGPGDLPITVRSTARPQPAG